MVEEGNPEQIAEWLATHRPTLAGSAALASRLADQLAEADPLGAAEIVASLSALEPGTPISAPAVSPPVSRRYLEVRRQPWTESLLAADEEPGEPTLRPIQGSIPLGAELDVALSAQVTPGTRFACLRDFPPVGLAPLDARGVVQSGLLICGPTDHDRLEVSYAARSVRAGRFPAPAAGLGAEALPGATEWVEVAK